MKKSAKKTSLIKARCEPELKTAIENAANVYGVDYSDIVRLACRKMTASILGGESEGLLSGLQQRWSFEIFLMKFQPSL